MLFFVDEYGTACEQYPVLSMPFYNAKIYQRSIMHRNYKLEGI